MVHTDYLNRDHDYLVTAVEMDFQVVAAVNVGYLISYDTRNQFVHLEQRKAYSTHQVTDPKTGTFAFFSCAAFGQLTLKWIGRTDDQNNANIECILSTW